MSLAFAVAAPLAQCLHAVPRTEVTSVHTRRYRRYETRASLQQQGADGLARFARAVRGEWTGYEAVFDLCGQALPIPDYYIPEQFVEWALTPLGFETNHSIVLRDTTLFIKFFRILPVVTLFADHVDLEEDLVRVDITQPGTVTFDDGCFVVGNAVVPVRRESRLDKYPAIRFCLRDPRHEQRSALHVKLSFDFERACLVKDLTIILEKWSCEYCDGADIDGSSGFVEGWAVESAMQSDALRGVWAVDGGDQVRRDGGEVAEEGRQVYLPRGIDVAIRRVADDLVVTVGWLVHADHRIVVRRTYDHGGALMRSERLVERRVEEDGADKVATQP